MKLSEILTPSFKNYRSGGSDNRPMWSRCLSTKSSFCQAVVQTGLLTERQIVHAALRYRLGCSKENAVIYWQIDQLGQTHDGKLMWYGPDCHRVKHRHATWASHLLKRHYGVPDEVYQPVHCFFGLHLLALGSGPSPKFCSYHDLSPALKTKDRGLTPVPSFSVAIVEAEKTAVILSELYPQYIWLAAGGMNELQTNKFFPIRHHKVILFPDTDSDLTAFTRWYNAAQEVMASFFWPKSNPIRVSPILERCATPDQKRRKIDLVDYLLEKRATLRPE